jgi:hypothetical protein
MLYTWFQPWWSAYIVELDVYAVTIYPYGIEINLGDYPYWLAGAEYTMPLWFFTFMWIYLGLCIALLLYSLFASERRVGLGRFSWSVPQVLVVGVGLSYVIIVAAAVITIAIQSGNFYNAPLQGSIFVAIDEHYQGWVDTGLLFGYWFACGVGPFLILLALLRNKIIGR